MENMTASSLWFHKRVNILILFKIIWYFVYIIFVFITRFYFKPDFYFENHVPGGVRPINQSLEDCILKSYTSKAVRIIFHLYEAIPRSNFFNTFDQFECIQFYFFFGLFNAYL